MRVTIRGLQEAQRANTRLMAAIRPENGLGRAVLYLTTQAQRYEISVTHVKTGALRASHRMQRQSAARYLIYIDPSAKNPLSGARTAAYGPVENARGGSHAFAERTFYQGPTLAREAIYQLVRELP